MVLDQGRGKAALSIDGQASFVLRLPLEQPADAIGFPIIIAEVVQSRLHAGLGFISEQLERLDPTHSLAHLGIAVRLSTAEHAIWRTRQEHDAHRGSVTLGWGQRERPTETQVIRRAELDLDRTPLIEDLVVRLAWQFEQ